MSECWAGKWRGIAENAAEIEAITRYSDEQGLAVRKLSPEDILSQVDVRDFENLELIDQCPDSEVRHSLRHIPMRTSESKGHWQLYDSSAVWI
jgi:hypothetical protein